MSTPNQGNTHCNRSFISFLWYWGKESRGNSHLPRSRWKCPGFYRTIKTLPYFSGTLCSFHMMNAATSFCGSGTVTYNFDTSYWQNPRPLTSWCILHTTEDVGIWKGNHSDWHRWGPFFVRYVTAAYNLLALSGMGIHWGRVRVEAWVPGPHGLLNWVLWPWWEASKAVLVSFPFWDWRVIYLTIPWQGCTCLRMESPGLLCTKWQEIEVLIMKRGTWTTWSSPVLCFQRRQVVERYSHIWLMVGGRRPSPLVLQYSVGV